ncbi:MAG TPA: MarR family transcriptional regulator [Acidimicrobiia bacterium]|nr:MarR family transcriptional regulator [Acidimicrobiia bacterium]
MAAPVSSKAIPTDAAATAARLRVSATRLARQLRQESDAGLSPSQLSALTSVELHGPLTLGRLAEHERVAPPSVTKVVTKLEEAGLVERRLDAADRRVAWISISAAGAARLAKIRQRKNVWLATRLAKLDDDARRRIADALDALDAITADPV